MRLFASTGSARMSARNKSKFYLLSIFAQTKKLAPVTVESAGCAGTAGAAGTTASLLWVAADDFFNDFL